MRDFTPSLDEVRAIYASWTPAHHVSPAGAYAEFDRAIDKVRAEAKAEALREAASDLDDAMVIDGKGSYRAGPDNCANWLRARAEKLATK